MREFENADCFKFVGLPTESKEQMRAVRIRRWRKACFCSSRQTCSRVHAGRAPPLPTSEIAVEHFYQNNKIKIKERLKERKKPRKQTEIHSINIAYETCAALIADIRSPREKHRSDIEFLNDSGTNAHAQAYRMLGRTGIQTASCIQTLLRSPERVVPPFS